MDGSSVKLGLCKDGHPIKWDNNSTINPDKIIDKKILYLIQNSDIGVHNFSAIILDEMNLMSYSENVSINIKTILHL